MFSLGKILIKPKENEKELCVKQNWVEKKLGPERMLGKKKFGKNKFLSLEFIFFANKVPKKVQYLVVKFIELYEA